jgi:hypothetical protein
MKKVAFLTTFLLLIAVIGDINSKDSSQGSILMRSFSAITSNKLMYKEVVEYDVLYKNVKGTVYHAVKGQTDKTPLVTADNSKIDTFKVNDLRWVALSRDLLNRKYFDLHGKLNVWSGKIKLGDTIWIDYDTVALWKESQQNKKRYEVLKFKYELVKGYWIVHDVMGSSYMKRTRKGKPILDKHGKKQKVYIFQAIDFLQHPTTGMLDAWDRNLVISKRKTNKIILPS